MNRQTHMKLRIHDVNQLRAIDKAEERNILPKGLAQLARMVRHELMKQDGTH